MTTHEVVRCYDLDIHTVEVMEIIPSSGDPVRDHALAIAEADRLAAMDNSTNHCYFVSSER